MDDRRSFGACLIGSIIGVTGLGRLGRLYVQALAISRGTVNSIISTERIVMLNGVKYLAECVDETLSIR